MPVSTSIPAELKVWTREYLALEVDLRHGLREQQFVLHYQPQFDMRTGALVGSEALLRWQRSPQDLVQPNDFIGVAEETGLIVEIGAWVVMQVARDLADALAARRPALPVAVNVSARQCVNRNIVQVLRRALRETRIPAALIKLEITETTAMTDASEAVALMQEIRALGVRIALDDFGTGYSSLSYLQRFPIDELKIDRSFVQHVATNPDDAAIVRATIALAHELGIQVVAEGVETEVETATQQQLGRPEMTGGAPPAPGPAAAALRHGQMHGELAQHEQVQALHLLTRPGRLAQEPQAGRHAGVVRETAHRHTHAQFVPAVVGGQVGHDALQRQAMQGIAWLGGRRWRQRWHPRPQGSNCAA